MKLYLASLGAGVLVGVIYSLIDVRSPAPPLVALLGLLGILIGEQIAPVAQRAIVGRGLRDAAGLAQRGSQAVAEPRPSPLSLANDAPRAGGP